MVTQTQISYGPGGYDPDAPDGNVTDRREVEVPDGPPSPLDRVAALEARLDAVAAKAEQASITAQEVAAAAKPQR